MEKLIFNGGINSDDDLRVMPQGDYRSAVNCRIGVTENGNNFSVTNTKGNTLVNYALPAGNSKTIGKYQDPLTSTITYFNYNDKGNHHILQYSWITNSISKIIQDSSLNFDINHKITAVNIVDNLLYWTDDYNEPRKLNITKALSGGYAPYSNDYAYAIKQPPLFPPTANYVTDTTKKINYLNNFLFQFKYRYFYDDYEKSACSPISTVPLPLLDASSFTDSLLNNRIDISINTGNAIVTKIELMGRIGNSGDFFSIVTLDKNDPYNVLPNNSIPSSYNYTFLFYNNSTYNNVDLRESIKLFDSVPRLAKAQELISPTRLSYGNILEGFNPVDVVAKLDVSILPPAPINTYDIHCGRVLIKSPFSTAVDTVTNEIICQPIVNIDGLNINRYYGGFAPNSTNTAWQIISPTVVNNDYDQHINYLSSGFVFYLAGTDYYATSKQNIPPGGKLSYNTDGTYNIMTNLTGDITTPIAKQCIAAIGQAIYDQQVYSEVTIKNVPIGKYILRVASHSTTWNDLNTNRRYQKTSECVVQIGGKQAYEIEIEIIGDGTTIVDGVTQTLSSSNNVIELDPTIILDMTNAVTGEYSNVKRGYLFDHDASAFPSSLNPDISNAIFSDETKIELAEVLFGYSVVNNPAVLSNAIVNNWASAKTYTDHNGFYFFAGSFNNAQVDAYVFVNSFLSGNLVLPLSSAEFYPYPGIVLNGPGYGGPRSVTIGIRTHTQGYFDDVRTAISGRFTDSAGPVKGVLVVVSRGGLAETDVKGNFSIKVYSDTIIGTQRQADIFYKLLSSTFFETFSPPKDRLSIGFSPSASGQTVFTTPYSTPTGYNYAALNQLIIQEITMTAIGKTATSSNLKRAGSYQYGIVYYDHANRSGLTNTNDYNSTATTFSGKISDYGLKLYVPYYTETPPSSANIYGGGMVKVDWSIYHEPPVWATHYQWVRTKNAANNRFLQFIAKTIDYVNDSGGVSNKTSGTKIRIDITNIGDYDKKYPSSTLVYDEIKKPAEDRVRFIRDNNGHFFTQFVDLQVLGTDPGKYIYLENRPNTPDVTGMAGMLFEVYNPKLELAANEELFWEIGECFDIGIDANGKAFHKGPTGDQNTISGGVINNIPVTTVPATGTFRSGDTYYRLRDMTFTTGSSLYYIEDASVSDFYISQVSDIGRPNRFDPDYREVRRLSTIYYSELYIPETKINNLNSFFDTNFETYEQKYGGIQKLYNENHRLIAYQTLKVGQIPVNQNIIYDNAGTGALTSSEKVLNDIIYYAGEFGMTHPESFAVFGSNKYFVDANRLTPIRQSNAGLDPISENESGQIKMHTYFAQKLALYQKTSNAYIYGEFDKDFKNYILAFEKLEIPEHTITHFSNPGGLGPSISSAIVVPAVIIAPPETIVFDELNNRWKSTFEYYPDFMCAMNDSIVSFKDGKLYTHNTNPLTNNFYGVQYNSVIAAAGKQNPSAVKVLLAISLETADAWAAEITTEDGQLTHLYETDFSLREGLLYSDVYRNENTPNVTDPGINGEEMRGTAFLIKLTNSLADFTKLFAINVLYVDSPRSNR